MKLTQEKQIKVISKNDSFEQVKISNSGQIETFIRQFYSDDIEIYESFFIALLNRQNVITGWAKISQGGIAGTFVDPILVAKYAIETLSKAVIVCHNHPSGNLNPSRSDLDITQKIKKGLELFDIDLLDHLILTNKDYYSFADEGKL